MAYGADVASDVEERDTDMTGYGRQARGRRSGKIDRTQKGEGRGSKDFQQQWQFC